MARAHPPDAADRADTSSPHQREHPTRRPHAHPTIPPLAGPAARRRPRARRLWRRRRRQRRDRRTGRHRGRGHDGRDRRRRDHRRHGGRHHHGRHGRGHHRGLRRRLADPGGRRGRRPVGRLPGHGRSSRPTGTPRPSTAGSTRWSATATRSTRTPCRSPARSSRRRRRHRRGHRDPLRRPGHRQPDGHVAAVHRRRHPARLRLHRRGHPERRRVPDRGGHGGHGEEPADDHVGPGDVPRRRDDRRPRQGRASSSATSAARRTWTSSPRTGILSADQVDGSYDGTPANFIAAEGKDAQQGFGSAEPYKYEFEFTDWGKPVAYQYINDAGWENYGESIATKAGEARAVTGPASRSSCRSSSSRASTTWPTRPRRTRSSSTRSTEFDSFWTYSPEIAEYAVETMIDDGLAQQRPRRHDRQLRPRPRQRPDREGHPGLHRPRPGAPGRPHRRGRRHQRVHRRDHRAVS